MPNSDKTDVILVEDIDRTRIITFNRADKLNAVNHGLLDRLAEAMAAAAADDGVHAVILTGKGRAFSAGADLAEMDETVDANAAALGEDHPFNRLQRTAEAFPKPLIAAVNGIGVGFGFTILGYCDFCFVAESARLKTPFSHLGLCPEAGSSYTFPLKMGWAAAARALMLDEWFSAQDLVDCGLAQQVVPDAGLMETAIAFAARFGACPLQSLVATKTLMLAAHSGHLANAREREASTMNALVGSPANVAALKAFAERSAPRK